MKTAQLLLFFMANHWFQFRHFLIVQSSAAMKVGTDSLVLGSRIKPPEGGLILDIGTGTGILSLMMAQKSSALIHAVEINPEACQDAATNFQSSPWANRLFLHQLSIQDFANHPDFANLQFDCILSNPPYFANSLPSSSEKRNLARHNQTLTRLDLIRVVGKLLAPNGSFHLILPFDQADTFSNTALISSLFEFNRLIIKPTKHKAPNRVVLSFGKEKKSKSTENIILREDDAYSPDYLNLCSEFYSDDFLKKNTKKT